MLISNSNFLQATIQIPFAEPQADHQHILIIILNCLKHQYNSQDGLKELTAIPFSRIAVTVL